MMIRSCRLVVIGVLGVALAAAPIVTVQAGSRATPPSTARLTSGRLAAGRLVNVRHLPAAPSAGVARDLPFLSRNPRKLATLKAPSRSVAAAVSKPPLAPQPLTSATVTSTEEQLTVFAGMNLDQQIGALGPSEGRQPPDTQIAAGPNLVMEMDNRAGSFWTKAGTLISMPGNPFDLQPFFDPSPGPSLCPSSTCLITGPRLLFDAASGRWLASANGQTPDYVGMVFFAISNTSDPTSTWTTFSFTLPAPGGNTGMVADLPTLGVSDDKVTLAWSDFFDPGVAPCVAPGPFCYFEQEIKVIDKGQLLAGNSNPATSTIATNDFGVVPVQSLSSTTTQYLVYNNADPDFLVQNGAGPTLGVIALTGTPSAAGGVSMNETDPTLTSSTTAPPDAVQAGSSRLIATDDDRLESAVWQNGQLWTSATVGCGGLNSSGIPKGACLRLWHVSTGASATLLQDVFVVGNNGGVGDYLYYPAQSVDAAANLYIVFSRSNASTFPGSVVMGQLAGAASRTPMVSLLAGQGPYDPITPGCSNASFWGNYSSAAVDPTDPTDAWVAAEYTPDGSNSCQWGTAVGRLTFSGPSITSAAPSSSPRVGGASVVIRGRDFAPNTTVRFDGYRPNAVTVTADQITAVSPPHLPGTIVLSVTTPNGEADVPFTYLSRPESTGSVIAAPGGSSRPLSPPVSQSLAGTRLRPI
jgi:hypothetical protein